MDAKKRIEGVLFEDPERNRDALRKPGSEMAVSRIARSVRIRGDAGRRGE